jgi:hypothetical protein
MRPTIIGLLAAAGVFVSSAGAQVYIVKCSPMHGGFENHIRSYNLKCDAAHKIVNRWHRKAVTKGQGPGNKTVGDFRCKSKSLDAEHVAVTCTHKEFSQQYVKFHAGP